MYTYTKDVQKKYILYQEKKKKDSIFMHMAYISVSKKVWPL